MRELALFAGAGGGILGGKLLGWRTVCAVEIDPYARAVLLARQRDGHLERFPIWDDIRTFDGHQWRGRVDVVSGGFPCQAFSSAARGRNNAADLWPDMLRVIRCVRPMHVFAENVKRHPIERAAADLCRLGYGASFGELSAGALGAPHKRSRWWLRGDAHCDGQPVEPKYEKTSRLLSACEDVWTRDEMRSFRVPDGVAGRVDRLRAAGNGQIPIVAAVAWDVLGSAMGGKRAGG